MRHTLLLAALTASLLAGCAEMRPQTGSDSTRPTVDIDKERRGQPAVSPNVLVFPAGQGAVTISWRFPPGSTLRFAPNGIVIEGEITTRIVRAQENDRAVDALVLDRAQKEIVDCRIAKEGTEFTCLNRHTRPGIYKYTVRVLLDGRPLAPLDPTVANN